MISILNNKDEFDQWLSEKRISFEDEDDIVKEIIQEVKEKGDEAIRFYTEKFDKVNLEQFEVSQAEIDEALSLVSPNLIESLERAKNNIYEYHIPQKIKNWAYKKEGKELKFIANPIDRAALYVPGGKGIYPSSVLMTAIPAKIAGVPEIVMISPPDSEGKLHPVNIAAAEICGVDRIFKMGGVQAVAGVAYGTKQVPKVDKVVGPGNAYVTMAKKFLIGTIDIDSLAGPSEVMILVDEYVPLKYIVSDMLSQAEHSEDAQSIVLVPSSEMAKVLSEKLEETLMQSKRSEILKQSVINNSCIVVYDELENAFDVINHYAAEHLQILMDDLSDEEILKNVKHAGAIFIGRYTPVALGDYYCGTNHTLPTNGTAKFSSPLGVADFMKVTSVIKYNREQLLIDREYAIPLAEVEGFYEHANSMKIRD